MNTKKKRSLCKNFVVFAVALLNISSLLGEGLIQKSYYDLQYSISCIGNVPELLGPSACLTGTVRDIYHEVLDIHEILEDDFDAVLSVTQVDTIEKVNTAVEENSVKTILATILAKVMGLI